MTEFEFPNGAVEAQLGVIVFLFCFTLRLRAFASKL